MPIQSVNPATGEVAAIFDEFNPDWTRTVVDSAARAWEGWRKTGFAERSACLKRAATLLRDRAPKLAATMALEMGKPVRQGEGEGPQVRGRLRLLRRPGRDHAQARTHRGSRRAGLCQLRAPGRPPFGHALELPPVAGVPHRGPRPSWPETPWCSNTPPTSPNAPWPWRRSSTTRALPDNVFRSLLIGAGQGGKRAGPPRGVRRQPDRQRARRAQGGGCGRSPAQEVRHGTGGQRSLHRPSGRGPGKGRAHGRALALRNAGQTCIAASASSCSRRSSRNSSPA